MQAFPVLCRILTELKLLRTSVGIVVLSAGVGNDVVGWILLALCVALVNAGTGLTALWVLLTAVGYTLFLFLAVRPAFVWLLRRTGALQSGPSQGIIALTLLLVLTSSFFTSIIGIHAIFGAFMIGLICPHEGGFAIKVTEKIEDLVSALLLPLYFALSGLSTNLGLLDNGLTWGYVVGILAIAFLGKVAGGTIAARIGGMVWRESFAIGALMSCKGLVELIVLVRPILRNSSPLPLTWMQNIGLQAGILSTRTFTMFVVMALLTTFATTPLVSALYPPWYQAKLEAWKRGEIDWDGNRLRSDETDDDELVLRKHDSQEVQRLLAHLRLDSMAGVLALVSLLAKPGSTDPVQTHPAKKAADEGSEHASGETGPPSGAITNNHNAAVTVKRPFQVHGVRLTELTERSSSVMRVTELEEYGQRDPVLNTFRTFGQFSNVAVSGVALLGPEAGYASTLAERARDVSADLMLLPWSESGGMSELPSHAVEHAAAERFANGPFSHFVASTLAQRGCPPVALFIDNGFGSKRRRQPRALHRTRSALSAHSLPEATETTLPSVDQSHHLFCPFFGSADDRLALRLALQLAKDPSVTATCVHFPLPAAVRATIAAPAPAEHPPPPADAPEGPTGANGLKSPAATVTPAPAANDDDDAAAFFAAARDALPAALAARVAFETVAAAADAAGAPIAAAVARASRELGQNPKNAGDLLVGGQNGGLARALGGEGGGGGGGWNESEAGRALGGVVGGVVASGVSASFLVLKAAA